MQKAIIVGVNNNNPNFEVEMNELENLALACDIEVISSATQNLNTFNPKTYIGSGKVEEIKLEITSSDAELVIFNDELSPAQISNLEESLEVTIFDRTYIILEIFNRRAQTKEAVLQVDIATLNYLRPRLVGMRKGFSRQRSGAAGSGAYGRGMGETKLELDRRKITYEISKKQRELNEITKTRLTQRKKRKKNNIPVVSLVGYTNSGKSTTLNQILNYSTAVKKDVFQKDMLFATLETASRLIKLENNHEFILTDTIGFINKLPHQLIEAFKSTLEEITESDLIIHVADLSNPHFEQQIKITNDVIKEIGVKEIPIIYAFNKIDNLKDAFVPSEFDNYITISALKGTNIDRLIAMIEEKLFAHEELIDFHIPYKDAHLVHVLEENANVLSLEYNNDYIYAKAIVSPRIKNMLIKYKA